MVPVTILTGFLGSGKTTLINRVLKEQHGHRIAVIENEFGEAGGDNEILLSEIGGELIVLNNSSVCRTVPGALSPTLGEVRVLCHSGRLNYALGLIEPSR